MADDRLIVALDVSTMDGMKQIVSSLGDSVSFYKVGMELFYAEGEQTVRYLQEQGKHVFLDLKLHDIPNTVQSAMAVLAKLGVDMTNVHAAGGVEMMKAARAGLGTGPKLIAVTQLTSTSEEQMWDFQNIQTSLAESVVHYAKKTAEADLDGVVCSSQEVALIKQATAEDFICLTPGIRPSGAAVGDQKRVMTPAAARATGSEYIVVGRPITQADNPVAAYLKIKEVWNAQ